jgi:hypothetical protein
MLPGQGMRTVLLLVHGPMLSSNLPKDLPRALVPGSRIYPGAWVDL